MKRLCFPVPLDGETVAADGGMRPEEATVEPQRLWKRVCGVTSGWGGPCDALGEGG